MSASGAEPVNAEPSEFYYDFDGKPWNEAEVKYDVDVSSCRKHRAYETTVLAHDKDDKIVGGTVSDEMTRDRYRPNSQQEGSFVPIFAPARDVSYKAYPYAKPVKPRLEK